MRAFAIVSMPLSSSVLTCSRRAIPELIEQWIAEAGTSNAPILEVCHRQQDGQPRVIATGYQLSQLQSVTHAEGTTVEWTERVLLVHSPVYEQQQQQGLDQRISTATAKLKALTPPVGRGQRQIRELAVLQQKAQAILKSHRVEKLLAYTYTYCPATKTLKERYQIAAVTLNTELVEQARLTFGAPCLCHQRTPRAVIAPRRSVNLPRAVDSRARIPSLQG